MLIAFGGPASSRVWPSAGDFAARSEPILVAPPGRLSRITCWPQITATRWATMRAMRSALAPGTYGTSTRTARAGNACAHAPSDKHSDNKTLANAYRGPAFSFDLRPTGIRCAPRELDFQSG